MLYNKPSESPLLFSARDAINTFAHGDKIDLSGIDANAQLQGDQSFSFGQDITPGRWAIGQLEWVHVATNSWLVWADTSGDGVPDFALNIYSSPLGFGQLHSWDFIL
jgi:hypothetical protein